jgi:cyclophilin family peptidyl-prolyl cis-trans isomerase
MTILLLGCLWIAAPLPAQDDAKEPQSKSPAAQQTDDPAKTATVDPGSAEARFQAKFAEWKSLLVELRQLRSTYQETEEVEQRQAMAQQWDEIVAQGEAMLPELIDAVLAAYEAAPNEDRVKTNFLSKVLTDYVTRDIYEPALRIGNVLVDNGCQMREVLRDTGTAAFALNDFQRSGELLELAAQMNVLSGDGASLREPMEKYAEYWKQEQEIRAQEAKDDDLPRVKLITTQGDIVVELFENEAPDTVGNFISLVKRGFYEDIAFHRVVPGFMAQTGCPLGDGTGGPGYRIYDEYNEPGFRRHFGGVLSMAKTNAPNSGGSQFFITFRPTPELDGQHTVFGRVISGMDVMSKLKRSSEDDTKPVEDPDKILEAVVLRDRGHEYLPNKVE